MNQTSTAHRLYDRAPAGAGLLPRLAAALRLRRERQQLSGLSATQLRDIGITRQEAEAEARRPAWDAPDHWHR